MKSYDDIWLIIFSPKDHQAAPRQYEFFDQKLDFTAFFIHLRKSQEFSRYVKGEFYEI